MVATADVLVYNAEKILSLFFLYFSFFNQVTSIFHLRGGEIKKKVFLGLPTADVLLRLLSWIMVKILKLGLVKILILS